MKVGKWTVLPALNLLECDDKSIRIKPRTMDVLMYLAGRPGEVVSADELVKSLWKGRVVGDGAVYQSITQLRHALGDGLEGMHFIETIPKRGYRLLAPVTLLQSKQSELEPGARENWTSSVNRISAALVGKRIAPQRFGIALVVVLMLAMVPVIVGRYVFERDRSVNGTTVGDAVIRRYEIDLGLTQGLWETGLSTHVTLSRDGRSLAYAARTDGVSQLYLRPLGQLEAQSIPGTEGGIFPFFSYDGEWLAFYDGAAGRGQLKKVPVGGGTVVTLADTTDIGGGSWGADDAIVVATRHVRAMPWGSLIRIPAAGGSSEVLLGSDSKIVYEWPDVLPGGEAVLFTVREAGQSPDEVGSIGVLFLETGDYRLLVEDAYFGRFVASGHIVFVRGGALWAVPFDPESMQATGPEKLVLDGVQIDRYLSGASYAFSDDGLLVYSPESDGPGRVTGGRSLVWVDRETAREEIVPIQLPCCSDRPRISPDGERVALEISAGGNIDIWIYEFVSGASTRLTMDPTIDEVPLWYPDSQRVVFLNHELGGLFSRSADGTGQIEQLTRTQVRQRPESFSSDGSELIVTQARPGAMHSDLHLLSLDDERSSRPLIQTEFDEAQARISPDGRWVAYMSNQTGQDEIHVRRFPHTGDGGQWQVSRDGGAWPVWGPDGTELFYRAGDAMMAVPIQTEPAFSSGSPRVLFRSDYVPRLYDVSPDGRRFLMVKPGRQHIEHAAEPTRLIVVENWFAELRRLAPASR